MAVQVKGLQCLFTNVRIGRLDRGLLVIVRPVRGNPTETPRLLPRQASTGRLSVDLKVVSAVEADVQPNRTRAIEGNAPLNRKIHTVSKR